MLRLARRALGVALVSGLLPHPAGAEPALDLRAIFAAGAVAAALGLLLPWWFARTGRDPAMGSGPLATVLQDILSVLVYLGVVRAFGL